MANQPEIRDITSLVGDKLSFRNEDGAQLKESGAGILQSRNADDTAFAKLQVARPDSDEDAASQIVIESMSATAAAQVDTTASVPNNTAVARWLVVTTAGSGAAVGDILRDNGLNDALPMEIFPAKNGREVYTVSAFSGGTQTFLGQTQYRWNGDTGVWFAAANLGSVSGAERVTRIVGALVTITSTTPIPAGARATQTKVEVTTPYDTGTDLLLGNGTDNTQLLDGTETKMDKARTWVFQHDELWAVEEGVRAEFTNTPAAGACVITTWFAEVNL